MEVLQFAIGVIVGIGICGAIPRIAVGIYSAIKKKTYRIVDASDEY